MPICALKIRICALRVLDLGQLVPAERQAGTDFLEIEFFLEAILFVIICALFVPGF